MVPAADVRPMVAFPINVCVPPALPDPDVAVGAVLNARFEIIGALTIKVLLFPGEAETSIVIQK